MIFSDLEDISLPHDPPSLTSIAADLKRIADVLEKIAARSPDPSPARQAFAAKLYRAFQQR